MHAARFTGLRWIIIIGLIIAIMTMAVGVALAQSYGDGDTIAEDQTSNGDWGEAGGSSTLYLDANIAIDAGVTINILPNTTIIVSDGAGITVNGTLNIDGPVTFTNASNTPGSWTGIIYADGSSGYVDGATIEYAIHALTLNTANPITVSNGELRFNQHTPALNQLAYGAGLYIAQGNHLIDSTVVHHNTATATGSGQVRGAGVYIASGSPHILNSNIYENTATSSYVSAGGGIAINSGGTLIEASHITTNTLTGNGNGRLKSGAGIGISNDTTAVIKNSLIAGNRNDLSDGYAGGGGIGLAAGATISLVEGNVIYGNYVQGPDWCEGSGIDTWDTGNSIVVNNNLIAYNTAGSCLNGYGAYGGGMNMNGGGSGTRVVNNTIVYNQAGRGGGLYLQGGTVTAYNNIIAFNSATYDSGGVRRDTGTVDYNNIYNNSAPSNPNTRGTMGANNIYTDPLFLGTGDLVEQYHLQTSSQAIDAGTNSTPGLPADDYDDHTRPGGTTYDIGFDEIINPPTIDDQTFTIDENSADDTTVDTVVADDIDTGDTLTFAITAGNTGNTFAINPASGVITVATTAMLDFETTPSFDLTVAVTDRDDQTASATITIDLNDLNEAPTIADQTFDIDENSANNTPVDTVAADDVDAGDSLTFGITAGDPGGAFAIDPDSGEITVADSTLLDYETTTSFALTVVVTDTGDLTDSATVTVDVNDLNEAPTIANQSFDVDENSPNDTVVGTVSADDEDAGDSLTFGITAGNTGGAFAINPATGVITVATTAMLDFETTPSFALTVVVTDTGDLTDSAIVTIDINDVDYAPTLQLEKSGPATANVNEGASYTFEVSHAPDSDNTSVSNVAVNDSLTGDAIYVNGDTDGNDRLDDGETWLFTASYTVQPTDPDPLQNTATLSGLDMDGNAIPTATDSHSLNVEYQPVLRIIKSGPDTANLHDTVAYSFTVSHAAGSDGSPMTGLSVTDSVAGNATLQSKEGGDEDNLLEYGETWIFTTSHTITLNDSDPLLNTATVEGYDAEDDLISTTSSQHSLDIEYQPVLTVTKNGPDTVQVGTAIFYLFEVKHATDSDGSPVSNINLDDDVTGSPTLLSGDDGDQVLESWETWNYMALYNTKVTDPNPLVNTATVTGTDLDDDTATATDTHSTALVGFNPVIQIVKDGPTAASVGQTTTYSFTVSHAPTSDKSVVSNVNVTDDVAGVASLISGDTNSNNKLDYGESWLFTANYTVQSTDPDPLVNTAIVSGVDAEGQAVTATSNSHSLDLTFNPVLAITADWPDEAKVGDTIAYSFTLSHDAGSDGSPVQSVMVSDTLTGLMSLSSGDDGDNLLEQSETWVYKGTYTILADDPNPLPNPLTVVYEDQDAHEVTVNNEYWLNVNPQFGPDSNFVYLPFIISGGSAAPAPGTAPDLVVQDVIVTANGVDVIIRNIGDADVTTSFWVDLYVDPNPVPTGVNQTWNDGRSAQGIMWGVTSSALPFKAGTSITLSNNDAYYSPLSNISWPLPDNTPIYVQVDSANDDDNINYGAILETHEISNTTYNNIFGPVVPLNNQSTDRVSATADVSLDGMPDRP